METSTCVGVRTWPENWTLNRGGSGEAVLTTLTQVSTWLVKKLKSY